jgi:1-acyl-sn-glycerol-3-phosphate acyltransferase
LVKKGAKVVLKDSLKYIPVLGWAWSFSEFIFVKRVWEKDHKTLVEDLKAILMYPKDLFYAVCNERYSNSFFLSCLNFIDFVFVDKHISGEHPLHQRETRRVC